MSWPKVYSDEVLVDSLQISDVSQNSQANLQARDTVAYDWWQTTAVVDKQWQTTDWADWYAYRSGCTDWYGQDGDNWYGAAEQAPPDPAQTKRDKCHQQRRRVPWTTWAAINKFVSEAVDSARKIMQSGVDQANPSLVSSTVQRVYQLDLFVEAVIERMRLDYMDVHRQNQMLVKEIDLLRAKARKVHRFQ